MATVLDTPNAKAKIVGKVRRLTSLINANGDYGEIKSLLSSLQDDFSGDPDKDLSNSPPSPGQQAAAKASGPGDQGNAGSNNKGGKFPFPIKSHSTASALALNRFKKKTR